MYFVIYFVENCMYISGETVKAIKLYNEIMYKHYYYYYY